ncbi:DUF2145 domain-containing protein [Reyranella sp. CPCC 100927]|uniref:DUF2145 domain-containing protein n=1 Tax=Reyranella sp. CPCC 100927 TaxID=2599616 RepID=UPI0011B7E926|nr:DUF2145 domain-containing protein [Reyranella sp. CPCC 100927]TWT02675.1 DUF2145 domain-containing protein [Reyranella sp. CPCC 100927]
MTRDTSYVMTRWRFIEALGAVAAAVASLVPGTLPARASELACADGACSIDKVASAAAAAKRLERALDKTGVEVAIIARVGSDLSRHGISWTHAGIAWRDDPAGRWQVVHVLNDCGPASCLYRQGLMNFFLDEPLHYNALVLVPSPAVRAGLAVRLATGAACDLHQPRYSMLAYPFATSYQNSNQFVLENLALAQIGAMDGDRETAIDHLQQTRFQPHVVRFSGLERIGGSFKANVRFDDHPRADGHNNRYSVVTVHAVERWLAANGALDARVEVV